VIAKEWQNSLSWY